MCWASPPTAESHTGRDAASVESLVLRHAPTRWNQEERRQGWADEPLTDAARREVRVWAERLPAFFAKVICSDLARARETAQIIAASLALDEPEPLPGLREQHQGAWTGLTKEEIKHRWPERLRERPRRPVNGESAERVLSRVLATLAQVAAVSRGRCVLIVTHSGVIQVLERAAGVDAPRVPYLEGRWFRLLAPAEPNSRPSADALVARALTSGRQRLLGDVAAERPIAERR